MEPIRVTPQTPIKNKQPITYNVLNSDSSLLNNEVEKTQNLEQQSSEDRTPRPPNAFILYRRSKQAEVTQEYGNISNAKISKILAKLWRNEDKYVNHYWQKLADKKKWNICLLILDTSIDQEDLAKITKKYIETTNPRT
ncbi:11918_t:CDS:2 [Racocetra fulgida]|uniref:11918_t:CDS:1 n=1 Tax=Racocetra fulgida TaxID=60492 RepID=A0A9N9BQ10_9GLOM|nr:11918_t:CDS:2 [Racocetra fulgida]